MRRTVGEQHPQPVTGHEPPVCVQPALRRGVEVEGLNQLVAVQIVGDQSRHMLDQVGKLECPVTASRVLEVDQPDPDPVPQEVARLPSACPAPGRGQQRAPRPATTRPATWRLAACVLDDQGPARRSATRRSTTVLARSRRQGLQTRRGVAASAAAGTQRCKSPTAATIDATGAGPPRRSSTAHPKAGHGDLRRVASQGAPNGAGAKPGANSCSSKSAPHSRAGSPRSLLRNRLVTCSAPRSTSCVLVPAGIAA